ncbi:MAG: hypothetical protein ACI4HO_05580 [Ruminococcus sp.]
MSSTNKTANLGLNSWIESDRPKRTDFVSDNTIIDNVLGNHVKDNGVHLTAEEKQRVTSPFEIYTIYGNGNTTLEITPGFVPQMVIYCKKNAPYCVSESGYTKVNAGIATSKGTSGGISISNNSIIVQHNTTAANGILYNFNENQAQYLLVAFR